MQYEKSATWENMKSDRYSEKEKKGAIRKKCNIERVQHEESATLKECNTKKIQHEQSAT